MKNKYLIIIGILIIILGIGYLIYNVIDSEDKIYTTATVLEKYTYDSHRWINVEYEVDGKDYVSILNVYNIFYDVGDEINVYYYIDEPSNIYSKGSDKFASIILIVLGAVIGIIGILKSKILKSKSAKVA